MQDSRAGTCGLFRRCSDVFRINRVPLRYPALGLLFNLPGNSLIGGGGGIALLSGMSSGLSWPKFALTVTLATVFVPLLALLGVVNIATLIQV